MISTRDPRLWLVAAAILALSPAASAAPGASLLDQAEQAIARNDGIAAEAAVERALAAGSKRDEVAAFAGEAELLQGDTLAARAWLGPGRFTQDNRERGFRALARLEIQEGDFAAAAGALDRALEGNPRSAELWVEIGRLRYRAGQHHLSLAAAIRAVEVGPTDARAIEFRGQLVRDARGPVAALPWFERALEQAPDDVELLGEYAATMGEAGRHRDMLRVVRRMIELDRNNPRAFFLQAVLAARAGQDGLARRLLDRTNGAYDQAPAGQMLAGVIELRTGIPALAVNEFEALVQRQPDNAAAALLLGRALLANGDAAEIVARFRPAADRADASPYLLALVGRAYEQLGRRAEAAPYLDRAGTVRPNSLAVLATGIGSDPGLGARGGSGAEGTVPAVRMMLLRGRRGEARVAAERMMRRYPGSADVETLSGDVKLLAGDPVAALSDYARAAQVRRDFALVERMVAALRMIGREDTARALLADYLANNPRSLAAAAMLGRLAAQRGDRANGAVLLGYARTLGGSDDPRLLADLAETELALGWADQAGQSARRAYGLQRSNGRVARVLARILHAEEAGGAEAEALLAKARQRGPAVELARR